MDTAGYVRDLAARIRGGSRPSELGGVAIAAVKLAWRNDEGRDDAQTIIDAFPADFPLIGGRASD